MASKSDQKGVILNNRPVHQNSSVNNPAFLNALGNLSSITPESHANVPLSSSYLQPYSSSPRTLSAGPPPLPPRRSQYMSSYNRYPGYGMSGYYSPYNRYSSAYSPYGGYRMPYGQYGAQSEGYNSFLQMAEESTRPAFESIESVVEVVSSISMMLESTYHAVHSSYSAILGVVDQFSRLKDHLAQILSVLALYRGLRWLCLKCLYLLRLRKTNPSVEAAWNTAKKLGNNETSEIRPEGSAWPFLLFISLVIGAPWLMFKLLSKNVGKKTVDLSLFVDETGKRYSVQTGYDFAASRQEELSFRAGEKLFVAPKSFRTNPKGWLLAMNNKQETGLIPASYLLAKQRVPPTVRAAVPKPAAMSRASDRFPQTTVDVSPEFVADFDETLKNDEDAAVSSEAKVVESPEDSTGRS